MLLINCEVNLILTWLANCFIKANPVPINNQVSKFAIADTKIYVLVVTLSTQDNVKLLQQLKWGFKRTTKSNIYQSKVTRQATNPHLDCLIDPSFQGVRRTFVQTMNRARHIRYVLPNVKIKD